MKVMLPSVAGSQSCLHAVLERDPFNTITLHLLPDVLVINRSPVTLQLLTENTDLLEELTNERGEGVKEIVSTLDPNNVSLLPQNKVCSYNVFQSFFVSSEIVCFSSFICLLNGRVKP